MRKAFAGILLFCTVCALSQADAQSVTARPIETRELLGNPGMGWESFYQPAAEDETLGGLPSTVMYERFHWTDCEPKPGEYDWTVLDKAVADATASGQTLALRVMALDTSTPKRDASPSWLKDLGCKIHVFRHGGRGRELWTPDFDDAVFLERHIAFIKALGVRYNGRKEISSVDIGSIGLWGEWHMSSAEGAPMPTEENARKIIDAYFEAFPDTPLVMQLDDIAGMKYAAGRGAGWRVDCWGDMGGFSKTWCHMNNMYPQSLERAGAADLWKSAPVALETCWDMRRWADEEWDVDFILEWALDQHATLINNKSRDVPEQYKSKVRDFLLKVGYRFVLRECTFDSEAKPGGTFAWSMKWENIGVAPCYYDYHPAIALASDEGVIVARQALTGTTIKGVLPGEYICNGEMALPSTGFLPGRYKVLAAITDRAGLPAVNIAIEGRRPDGWYEVASLDVK